MSREKRDLEFPADADLTVYQSGDPPRRVTRRLRGDRTVLEEVELDRFGGKLVVRADREGALPVVLEGGRDDPNGLVLRPREGVPDPLGLGSARIVEAFWIEDGVMARRYSSEGRRLIDAGPPGPQAMPGEAAVFFRKLVGHFVKPVSAYLLVHLEGLERPDDTDAYLWARDRGGYLVIPTR